MARTRVYIKPFKSDGTYGEYVEVTQDCFLGSIGKISKKLDVSDFDIGIYTNSALSLSLRNDHGRYADEDIGTSIFRVRRSDSMVKITWDMADWDYFAGISSSSDIQGFEATVYEGLINDDSTTVQLSSQKIGFKALGFESVFDRTLVPDWTGTPPADNFASTLIKEMLAGVNAQLQAPVLTVDNLRINPANDVEWDDLTVFENKTCKEALAKILFASNSVLVMEGTTPVVSGRVATASVIHRFYGPGSTLGAESIQNIQDIRNGVNRTFNLVTWKDTSIAYADDNSISKHGVRKKEISIEGITNPTTQQAIVFPIAAEFGAPKQEFKLSTPLTYDVLALKLLDRISIDYPIVQVSTEALALYGVAEYGIAVYPTDISTFEILPTDHYKIIYSEIGTAKNEATFTLRKI